LHQRESAKFLTLDLRQKFLDIVQFDSGLEPHSMWCGVIRTGFRWLFHLLQPRSQCLVDDLPERLVELRGYGPCSVQDVIIDRQIRSHDSILVSILYFDVNASNLAVLVFASAFSLIVSQVFRREKTGFARLRIAAKGETIAPDEGMYFGGVTWARPKTRMRSSLRRGFRLRPGPILRQGTGRARRSTRLPRG
jgi:hypothetical protein